MSSEINFHKLETDEKEEIWWPNNCIYTDTQILFLLQLSGVASVWHKIYRRPFLHLRASRLGLSEKCVNCEKLLRHIINRSYIVTRSNCSHALFAIFIKFWAAHKFGKFLFAPRSTNATATPLGAFILWFSTWACVKLIRLMRQLSATENLHRVFSRAVKVRLHFSVAQKVQLSVLLDVSYLRFLWWMKHRGNTINSSLLGHKNALVEGGLCRCWRQLLCLVMKTLKKM